MIKNAKRVIFFFLLIAGSAQALMPPSEIAALNLESEIILVGKVTEIGAMAVPGSLPGGGARALHVIEVIHVIKGFGEIEAGTSVRMLSLRPPEPKSGGVSAELAGMLMVTAAPGDLVVVYLSDGPLPGYWRPSAGGSSVIVIRAAENSPAPMNTQETKSGN